MLRKHQQAAIDLSIHNNFSSGIHSHATGTGKSIIGLELVLNYNDKYPENHVLWFCEQKACLTQLFNKLISGLFTLLRGVGRHKIITSTCLALE